MTLTGYRLFKEKQKYLHIEKRITVRFHKSTSSIFVWYKTHLHQGLNRINFVGSGLRNNHSNGHPMKPTFLSVKFKRLMKPKISSSSTSSSLSSETSVCCFQKKKKYSFYLWLRSAVQSPGIWAAFIFSHFKWKLFSCHALAKPHGLNLCSLVPITSPPWLCPLLTGWVISFCSQYLFWLLRRSSQCTVSPEQISPH